MSNVAHPASQHNNIHANVAESVAATSVATPAATSLASVLAEHHLDVGQVAAMLGCHGGTIYRAVHQGELDCIRVGDRYRFSERGVLAYLNRR